MIGGGDWAKDRLVPDAMRAFLSGQHLMVRNPDSFRPWQHVLEPLFGYLLLAQRLRERGEDFADAWNFGPGEDAEIKVRDLVETLAELSGGNARWKIDPEPHQHEARALRLDFGKAREALGWHPRMSLGDALKMTLDWHRFEAAHPERSMREISLAQIDQYMARSAHAHGTT